MEELNKDKQIKEEPTLLDELTERVSRLETLLHAYINQSTIKQEYINSDINGNRQSIANIIPTTITKTAYIGDTKIVFNNVPDGNLTVYFDESYKIDRDTRTDRLTLTFEPLKKVTDITISIL